MLVAVEDVILWKEALPDASSLVVALYTLFRSTLEDGSIEVLWIELQDINEILPCP